MLCRRLVHTFSPRVFVSDYFYRDLQEGAVSASAAPSVEANVVAMALVFLFSITSSRTSFDCLCQGAGKETVAETNTIITWLNESVELDAPKKCVVSRFFQWPLGDKRMESSLRLCTIKPNFLFQSLPQYYSTSLISCPATWGAGCTILFLLFIETATQKFYFHLVVQLHCKSVASGSCFTNTGYYLSRTLLL